MKSPVFVIIYIFMIFHLEKSKATFEISTFPNKAVKGEDFRFNCVPGNYYVQFRRDDITVCIILGINADKTCNIPGSSAINYIYTCNSSSYAVTIPGQYLTESLHNSTWECVNPLNTSIRSDTITLSINVPIEFVNISSNPAEDNTVTVIEGNTKQLTCRTGCGRPRSRIQWYMSSVNITTNATKLPDECASKCMGGKCMSSSHLIYKGNKDDIGKFIYCRASNLNGRYVRSMDKYIEVLYSPFTPSISQEPPAPVDENKHITLTCTIKGGNPPAVITWECNGLTPVVSLPVRNDTSVSQIQLIAKRIMNGKVCTCIGSHPAWTETNFTSIKFDIRYAPANLSIIQIPSGPVNEGKKVKLTCEIYGGNPLATITWTCDGSLDLKPTSISFAEKVVSSFELNISRKNDGNECICRGHHPLWNESNDERHLFNVYYSPNTSLSIIQNPPGSVNEKTKIILTCEVTGGKPLANITWQCTDFLPSVPSVSPTPGKSISSVELTVDKNQNGKVCICFGFHPTWEQNKTDTIQLNVKYQPESFLPITQTPTGPVIENDIVNLTCEIHGGNPVANISWTCDWLIPNTPIVSKLTDKVVSSIKKMVTREDNGKNCTCIGQHFLWKPVTQEQSHKMNVFYSSTIQILTKQPINVIENRTTDLECTEVDGNPRNTSFVWYKSTTIIGNTSIYSIKIVNLNDSGNYTCQGSNGFGKPSQAVSEVHVLYSPRVSALFALYGPTIEENGTAILQCSIQSNPSPEIVWMKHNRKTVLHSNGNQFQRNLTIKMANCLDTNNYTCKATNSIDSTYYTTMKDIELFVNCSPRRYDQQEESTNIIGLAVGQNLTITEHILAYPIYNITWTFKQNFNSSANVMQSDSDCSANKIFDHHICFSRQNLTENDFGMYSAIIVNDIGNATISFMVNPQEKPYISTNVNVTCGTLKVEVSWMTAYNGGQQQKFYIISTNKDGVQLIHRTDNFGNKKGVTHRFSLPMPAGPFSFDVFGNNSFGNATAKGASCEVEDVKEKNSVLGLAAGLGSSMAVLLIIIAAAVIFFRKRISKKKGDDTTLFKRSKSKTNEDDDDTLADNPLYVTSEIHDNGENRQVYSRVDKTKKRGSKEPVSFQVDLQGPVYSEVKKSGKKGKTSTELEMGKVYGNADSIIQDNNEDGVYANTENTSKSSNKLYVPKKNKDGLIYADLELENYPTGRKFVIRGLENRTNYAIIDLNVKVDPIPSDDDDNGEGDQEQHTDNGQNN